jgi:hypothetical protein
LINAQVLADPKSAGHVIALATLWPAFLNDTYCIACAMMAVISGEAGWLIMVGLLMGIAGR